ncbi:hypothetical protein LBMAG53_29020 [Planctomycetota bacterium]|nr:hypothetical protein LBMAG53_29020 [Planctomycetota bacterium]
MTMRSLHVVLLALCIVTAPAGEAKKKSDEVMTKLLTAITGTFDMSRNPRAWATEMIIDRKGAKYPSFWVGGGAGGVIVFNHNFDDLTVQSAPTATGDFTLSLVHIAYKYGMDDILPGGGWMPILREQAVAAKDEKQAPPPAKDAKPVKKKIPDRGVMFTFTKFEKFVFRDVRDGSHMCKDSNPPGAVGRLISVDTECSGTIHIGNYTTPFAGTAVLTFLDTVPYFKIVATIPIPGDKLGLTGADAAEPLIATLQTVSAASVKNAAPDAGGDPGLDLKE